MAKVLSARCLTSAGTVTMNPTTLEITTAVDDQKYILTNLRGNPLTVHTFAFKGTGKDILVKFNDDTDPNEECLFEGDIWEVIDFNASVANFSVKAEAGTKFRLRIMT